MIVRHGRAAAPLSTVAVVLDDRGATGVQKEVKGDYAITQSVESVLSGRR